MLSPATVDALDGYWVAWLGVPRSRLRASRPLAVPHAGLGDYAGMYAQAFGGAPIVSLPPALLERYGPDAARAAGGGLVDDERWRAVFGERLEAVVGPAVIAYADAGTLRPFGVDAEVRLLDEADRPALRALRAAVSPEAWEHGGSTLGDAPVAGVFADGALAAVSGYEVWGRRIAHLAVVTRPDLRGRGLGAAAVALAARTALDAGLVAQYRTLASNTSSMAIARRLGFVGYAASLAVRLRGE
ncbi:GNAT family N-acetyltransferase [Longimicrobium sp.]|uniref:GNAT family N-acetyltransferase n=1 Tax=Longimicrobium sp. TaxID=2029185 RepID=UPI002E376454|nr:GNAT family N-acetyltransferase [Longimicrobium sp.]HEX6036657.1 GNAT family N-acetyltransferase [Longimicrobium sp.]